MGPARQRRVVAQLVQEVKPNYTADAMRAQVQGLVELDIVVLPGRNGRTACSIVVRSTPDLVWMKKRSRRCDVGASILAGGWARL